jgi:hypothetical protein
VKILGVEFRRWPLPRLRSDDGGRYLLLPVHVKLSPRRFGLGWLFGRHGWQVGSEAVPFEKTSHGCMPGYRDVYGQTVHLGPIQIIFGPRELHEFPYTRSGQRSGEEVMVRLAEYHRAVEAGEVRPLHELRQRAAR